MERCAIKSINEQQDLEASRPRSNIRKQMKNRTAFAVLALVLGSIGSAWADRVIVQPEGSYELILSEVSLPRGDTGTVIFKPCPACTTTSMRVTLATSYFVNGTPLAFPDFLEAAEAIRRMSRGSQMTAVYLFFDIESRRINRLAVDHFDE